MNHQEKMVSIIIPCFNAESWLKEAIDSCLEQDYPNIEVIVIDDGSTDNSLEIMRGYGSRIIVESISRKGACFARNRGFQLSSGDYIQYLDADDYILPGKFKNQVRCLEETGADVVYSDWRNQIYQQDGTSLLGKIQNCGIYPDALELLLSHRQFMQTANPLFTRESIAGTRGWDESLLAGQDIDFFREVAFTGANFVYLQGCYAVYRVYDSPNRISSTHGNISLIYQLKIVEKTERNLERCNLLDNPIYTNALANQYFKFAVFGHYAFDYPKYKSILKKIKSLNLSFEPDISMLKSGASFYQLLFKIFGFEIACIIYKFFKDFVRTIKSMQTIKKK